MDFLLWVILFSTLTWFNSLILSVGGCILHIHSKQSKLQFFNPGDLFCTISISNHFHFAILFSQVYCWVSWTPAISILSLFSVTLRWGGFNLVSKERVLGRRLMLNYINFLIISICIHNLRCQDLWSVEGSTC